MPVDQSRALLFIPQVETRRREKMAAVARTAFRISVAAVFTALVAASTMVFSIYVPATRGYFNIGETMVYTTALLFGPLIGAAAGGLGSMMADVSLGYSQYAPGTLLIKGMEGFIVGYLGKKVFSMKAGPKWRIGSPIVAIFAAGLVGIVGATYYVGMSEASIGLPGLGIATLSLEVPVALWIVLALFIFAVIAWLGFMGEPQPSLLALAILAGGSVMVLGYFVYEFGVLGLSWAALAEVPINIGQVSVGLLVALPLVKAIRKRIAPWLR